MSSILDALKKLEEEKQRQIKLLEKEEEEEQELSEPISISAIAKPEKPVPLQDTVTPVISPKLFIGGVIVFVIVISIISISASLWVVKTQIAKNTIPSTSSEAISLQQKTTEADTSPNQPEKEIPPQEITSENKEMPSAPATPDNTVDKTKEKPVVSEPPPSPNITKPSDKLETAKTPPPEKVPEISLPVAQSAITTEPPVQVAKNITHETRAPVVEEVKKETPPPNPTLENIEEEVPAETSKENPPSEPSPSVENVPQNNETTNPTDSQKSTVSQIAPTQITTPPPIVTKDLEPPPSLKPEQFQQALALPKPKTEETVDMTRLPVLRTSDRVRLGLDDMKLNVLREAGPKNPHGLAIINLTKVYVGEMIPGTSVRLLDVKTHGIAIEVVGTGERYYVPR